MTKILLEDGAEVEAKDNYGQLWFNLIIQSSRLFWSVAKDLANH